MRYLKAKIARYEILGAQLVYTVRVLLTLEESRYLYYESCNISTSSRR